MATTVLLIEDDADVRQTIAAILEEEGAYEVVAARDGHEGLAHLTSHPAPALMLVDLMMPGMNGVQFVEAQRALTGHTIPVVVISADDTALRRSRSLQAAAYLRKPFTMERLLSVVGELCRRSGGT